MSTEPNIIALIRAGQEQTNARLEAILIAIHRLEASVASGGREYRDVEEAWKSRP